MRYGTLVRDRSVDGRVHDLFADTLAVEALRLAVRRELRVHRGQRALARLIGVSRSSLRKFVEMRCLPVPESLEKIREWAADRPDVRTPLGAVALAVLAGEAPAGERLRLRRTLAGEVARACAEAGVEVPGWVGEEVEARAG
jgi:transcriptional regulator with XRE-family HTH domain